MKRFPANDIISLVSTAPRYDLAESVGPDIRLGELLVPAERAPLLDLPLGYGTAAGDPRLRELIAALHEVARTMSSSRSAECTRCSYWRSSCASVAMK